MKKISLMVKRFGAMILRSFPKYSTCLVSEVLLVRAFEKEGTFLARPTLPTGKMLDLRDIISRLLEMIPFVRHSHV